MSAIDAGPIGWLRVDTPEAGYADAVVADLARIAGIPSGRVLLERVRASGRSVLIERPVRLDPPSADVRAQDLRAATAASRPTGETDADNRPILGTGAGSDCVTTYDPAVWPNPIDHTPSDVVLFALLRQALAYLEGRAEPTQYRSGEPGAQEAEDLARYRRERDGG